MPLHNACSHYLPPHSLQNAALKIKVLAGWWISSKRWLYDSHYEWQILLYSRHASRMSYEHLSNWGGKNKATCCMECRITRRQSNSTTISTWEEDTVPVTVLLTVSETCSVADPVISVLYWSTTNQMIPGQNFFNTTAGYSACPPSMATSQLLVVRT